MSLFALTLYGYAAALCYRLCPAKVRWVVLLIASLAFYASRSLTGLPLLLLTAFVTWAAALRVDQIAEETKAAAKGAASREEKQALRKQGKVRQRRIFGIALVLDFTALFVFKYLNDLLGLVGASPLGLLLPLGLSFYTFQSTGYLIDVYNGKTKPQRNPLRFLLFVSFFPQMLQGPIARYGQLSPQLEEPHAIDRPALVRATFLVIYGLFKKLVIADRVLPLVGQAFAAPESGAVVLLGVLGYSLQQYCDFSGGIDLVAGIAELFGIRLAPNFRQPYFSVSLADFWRRWHISLGAWMRDYVFYPFAVSKPIQKLTKAAKGRFGVGFSRTLPAVLGNLLVFLLVGLWHGATPNYIAWGLYNGLILALSALLEPVYKAWDERHVALAASLPFHLFRVLRTFIVVNIGWLFDRSATASGAFRMFGLLFSNFNSASITNAWLDAVKLPHPDRVLLAIACCLLFLISLLRERNIPVRERLAGLILPLRWLLLIGGICAVLVFGVWGSGFNEAAFIYNGF